MSMRALSAQRLAAPALEAFERFDPHRFLYEAWTGSGDVFGPTGARVATFLAQSSGRPTRDTRRILQDWTFSNGHAQRLDWRLIPAPPGQYRVVDLRSDVEADGREGDCGVFHWTATVRRKTRLGLQNLKVATVFRQVGPDLIETEAAVTMLGVLKIGRLVGVWRRDAQTEGG